MRGPAGRTPSLLCPVSWMQRRNSRSLQPRVTVGASSCARMDKERELSLGISCFKPTERDQGRSRNARIMNACDFHPKHEEGARSTSVPSLSRALRLQNLGSTSSRIHTAYFSDAEYARSCHHHLHTTHWLGRCSRIFPFGGCSAIVVRSERTRSASWPALHLALSCSV